MENIILPDARKVSEDGTKALSGSCSATSVLRYQFSRSFPDIKLYRKKPDRAYQDSNAKGNEAYTMSIAATGNNKRRVTDEEPPPCLLGPPSCICKSTER